MKMKGTKVCISSSTIRFQLYNAENSYLILSSEVCVNLIDSFNYIISVALETADNCDRLALSSWGLPEVVLQRYQENKITRMFEWQAECLCTGNVLGEYILNVLLIRLMVRLH